MCVSFRWGLETDVLQIRWHLKWALKDECILHPHMLFLFASFISTSLWPSWGKRLSFVHIGTYSAWMVSRAEYVNMACLSQFKLNLSMHADKSECNWETSYVLGFINFPFFFLSIYWLLDEFCLRCGYFWLDDFC